MYHLKNLFNMNNVSVLHKLVHHLKNLSHLENKKPENADENQAENKRQFNAGTSTMSWGFNLIHSIY